MKRYLLVAALMLVAVPVIIAVVAFALMWCVHQWNWPAWAVTLVGGALFAGSEYVVWRFARQLVANRFRFSIRGMLLGMAVTAVLLASLGRWWLDFFGQHVAIRNTSRYGADVDDGRGYLGRRKNALFDWIGFDPFEKERVLEINSDRALAEVLARPNRFSKFVLLSFNRGVTSAGFEHAERLNALPDLRVGQFMMSPIDEQGLQHLSKWTQVPELFFNGCPNVTDAGLAHLVELPNLEAFSLVDEGGGMVITDAGLVHIGQMKGLKYLMLSRLPNVTDAGLSHLHGLSSLEYFVIRGTAVTEEGLKELYMALPDCRIDADITVPGPTNVRRLVVRKLAEPDTPSAEVSDPARIGDVLKLLEEFKAGDKWESNVSKALPAELRLDFMGQTRMLYEIRIDRQSLQMQAFFRNRWTRWHITDEQQAQLMELLTPTAGE